MAFLFWKSGGKMNKIECKKILKKAYRQVIAHDKSITPSSIEEEIKVVINEHSLEYIAYSKLAINNMQHSANDTITLKDLLAEIDILPRIYTKRLAIEKSKNIC